MPFDGSEISPKRSLAPCNEDRDWISRSIELLHCDGRRSADTHLVNPHFPALEGLDIYLKDESTHPTGSLKHRLARSLFLYGICNGHIRGGTTLVEASSGSTAVSEAYFARLLGLPFIAVMPRVTSFPKVDAIERFGGRCHFVNDASTVYETAARIAKESGGHYLDQFTNAERATDWRGNNNIAESIIRQMQSEPHPEPTWIVTSAGTGGTAATLGRYIRYRNLATRLCVADVEFSAFYPAFREGNMGATCSRSSRIEGVGRPRVEPSFIPGVVDHMLRIPDAASIAAAHVLSERLFRRVGGSTGTNFMALLWLAKSMKRRGQQGSLVTLICDSGDRYLDTYFNDSWLAGEGLDIKPYKRRIDEFLDTGSLRRGGLGN